MLVMPKNMGEKYSPLYFLASVGAGGLATTFFMYLLYWVPHTGRPVPVFEDIMAYLSTADILGQSMVIFAMAAIAFFVYLNIRLLVWNLKEFALFKKTDAYINHQKSNAQTQVKAQALALAMSVNASFTAGLVFIPGLWSIIEYLLGRSTKKPATRRGVCSVGEEHRRGRNVECHPQIRNCRMHPTIETTRDDGAADVNVRVNLVARFLRRLS